jgi:hypothetical protein
MTIEPDDSEFEPWPAAAVDPIRVAIGNLFVAIMENTAEESPERKRAMSEALEAYERIKAALAPKPTLN